MACLLAFGRSICEAFFEYAPVRAKERIGELVRGMMSSLVPEYTYGSEIARHLSFDIGIDPDDKEEIRRVQLSPNNRRLTQETWGHLLSWLKRMGLVAPDYDWFDPPPPRPAAFAR